MEATSRKLPFGFYVCALSFSFERLAYYAAKWGITVFAVLYVSKGGLGLTKGEGALLQSWLVAFTYITPLIGGWIADRWISPRILVPVGELLMGAGYFVAWQATSKTSLILCIALVAIGTGFFKGVLSGVNGRQFEGEDQLLIKVFSYQYSFVNIGSFCGTTFLSLVALKYGYRSLFLACGIFMV
ncbi:MAG: MFS transporter, partial [Mogibacterium diversum]|nr:MFS transporter [Mogibacterium diversum]